MQSILKESQEEEEYEDILSSLIEYYEWRV